MPTMKTLTLFPALALPALAADTTIIGKVVGVHDGDTLTLRTEDETLKGRLSGIDRPELGRAFPATVGVDENLFKR